MLAIFRPPKNGVRVRRIRRSKFIEGAAIVDAVLGLEIPCGFTKRSRPTFELTGIPFATSPSLIFSRSRATRFLSLPELSSHLFPFRSAQAGGGALFRPSARTGLAPRAVPSGECRPAAKRVALESAVELTLELQRLVWCEAVDPFGFSVHARDDEPLVCRKRQGVARGIASRRVEQEHVDQGFDTSERA